MYIDYKTTMNTNIIYELRVICRSGDEGKYPFTVYTQSRYLFSTFADAEAAVQRLVQENSTKEWISVYRYEIYTFFISQNREFISFYFYICGSK